MKKDYIPAQDAEFDTWLDNFATKLPTYATTLGVDATQVTDITTGITNLRAKYTLAQQKKAEAKSWLNEFRVSRKTGTKDGLRPLINLMKANKDYTDTIGMDLRIVGEEHVVDLATAKPSLSTVIEGGVVKVNFDKQTAEAVRIYSRINQGTFSLIAVVLHSPFSDNRPNLQMGTPENREYFAFYMDNDVEVGLQSDTVSIKI